MKRIYFLIIVISLLLGGCTLPTIIEKQKPAEVNTGTPADIGSPSSAEKPANNKLDLSSQQLKKVPDYVFKLTNLEELDLSNNQLTGAIQAEIRHLQKLKVLKADNNLMTGVPAEIGQLQNLQILDLSNNQLTGLPYELGNLKNLKTFNISGNNYSTLDLGIITEKLPVSVKIIK
ncbi:MAG: leucine-rich repeat domain-containing protein [Patescibacteria group bacterium]|nr:leucine-rich repeat domain-containing protein [Patescibacteria group bacterium]